MQEFRTCFATCNTGVRPRGFPKAKLLIWRSSPHGTDRARCSARGLGFLRSEDLHARAPLEGKYANFFNVGHNTYEFVFEFGQLYESGDAPFVHTRIITSPAYAKELLKTLQEAVIEQERRDAGEGTD